MLAALGLLPDASVALTFPPQALVGVGLALTLSALTEAALAGRAPQAIHGGWTIASRHAGVVVGLLLLTPVFTADLETERADAEAAGTAALLDARLTPGAKLELAGRISEQIDAEGDKVPTIAPAFEPLPADPRGAGRDGRAASRDRGRGRRRRDARVQRLVSDRRRFRRCGADPDRDRPPAGAAVSDRALVGAAVAAATALVALYLVLGGGSMSPHRSPTPAPASGAIRRGSRSRAAVRALGPRRRRLRARRQP